MRNLRKEEYNLIVTLLKDIPNTGHIINELPTLMVEEMNDGGMGSLRFLYNDEKKRIFGEDVANIQLLDIDGMLVNFTINLDKDGDIFELDVFKGDFSPLIQFPVPPYNYSS